MPSTPERANLRRRERYRVEPEYAAKMKARAAKYRQDRAETIQAKQPEKGRKYREANREKLMVARRKYWAERPGLQLYHVRLRQTRVKRATPAWANRDAMKSWYARAAHLEVEVDHIVPLQSPLVCGLHWEGNFQLLPTSENCRKGNRYWPDMPYPSIAATSTGR